MNATVAPGCQPEEVGYLRQATVAFLSISFVMGIVGNGLVLWITVFRMARTVTTVWFINLALADFTISLLLPIGIHTVATGQWHLKEWGCKVYHAMLALIFFTSICLLVLISVDRCISVLHPIWARNHRTVQRANWLAFGVWLLASVACFPYLKFRATKGLKQCDYCYFNFNDDNLEPGDPRIQHRCMALTIVHFLLGFLAPLVIISICAHLIRAKLRREGWVHASRPKGLVLVLVSAFFICWFPFNMGLLVQLGRFMENNEPLDPRMLLFLWAASSLGYFNSCLNPFLYVFIGRDFQERFFRCLPSALARAFGEEGFPSLPAPKAKPLEGDGRLPREAQSPPA